MPILQIDNFPKLPFFSNVYWPFGHKSTLVNWNWQQGHLLFWSNWPARFMAQSVTIFHQLSQPVTISGSSHVANREIQSRQLTPMEALLMPSSTTLPSEWDLAQKLWHEQIDVSLRWNPLTSYKSSRPTLRYGTLISKSQAYIEQLFSSPRLIVSNVYVHHG